MLAADSRLRKQPSQERSRVTVDAFLEAADRVLRREGYEAASTNRLARVAGFSVGSLYQYFDDKQAVIGTLIDRELRREASDLVRVLDREGGGEIGALLRAAIGFLVERRVGLAHLHRTLADHGGELGCESPLVYSRRLQAPLTRDALQRVARPHLTRSGDGRLEPRLWIVSRIVHAVTYLFAVEAPVQVSSDALVDTLVRTVETYVAAVTEPSARAMELVVGWRDETRGDRPAGELRARRLQEVRTFLLRSGPGDPDALEPAVHVGAGVYGLVLEAGARPPGELLQERFATHFARLIEALPGQPSAACGEGLPAA